MFPLTEGTPLMEQKPPKHSFFLSLSGGFYHMLAEPRSPAAHPPTAEESPLISKVQAGGEKHKRKKIESEPLGNPWTSRSI